MSKDDMWDEQSVQELQPNKEFRRYKPSKVKYYTQEEVDRIVAEAETKANMDIVYQAIGASKIGLDMVEWGGHRISELEHLIGELSPKPLEEDK